MHRAAKIAVWTVAGVLGLVLLLVSAVLIIGNTEGGRALAARMTAQLTQGRVQITGIHGSFPSALDLDRLELRDANGLWFWADHISLRWSPVALLARHLEVDRLHVARLHVERAPLPEKEQKPSSSSSIPHTDLRDLSVDALELGAPLAGEPTSLVAKGNAHVRSLEDADAHVTARRTAGNGDYSVDVHLDAQSLAATVKLQEPANGPMAHLVKVPNIGALSVLARLSGPRGGERLQVAADAGPLRARGQGLIDLSDRRADIAVSVTAPAMTPYAGLSWDEVEIHGRFHGAFTTPIADASVLIKSLHAPGGVQLQTLEAHLNANGRVLTMNAGLDGLEMPGKLPVSFGDSRLRLDASVQLDDPKRPVQLSARHQLFNLEAKAMTAGDQSASLNLRIPDLRPFGPLSNTDIGGDAHVQADVKRTSSATRVSATADANLDGGTAAWAGLVRGGLTRLQMVGELTDQQISVEQLKLTAPALSVTADATAGRNAPQKVKARFDLGLPNLNRVSPALVGTMKVTGTVQGPRDALSADTRVRTDLSVRGSPRGTVSARLQAKDLPKAPQGMLEASGQLDGAPLQLNTRLERLAGNRYHALVRRADWKSVHAEGDLTLGKTVLQAHGAARFGVGRLSDFNRLLGSELSGSLNGQLGLSSSSGRSRAQLELQAQRVVVGGVSTTARLHANGPMEALNVSLDADSPAIGGQPAHLDTSALLNLRTRELQLVSLQGAYHNQNMRLLHPAMFKFANGFKVRSLALGAQEASVELDGQLSPVLDARADIRQLKADLINAFVPDLLASGTLEGDATIRGSPKAPTGEIHLRALGVKAKNAAAQGLPAADLRANAQLRGDRADVDTRLVAGSGSQMVLTGRAPLASTGAVDLKLAGNLDVALLNPILEAGGRHATGTVTMDTTVKGNPRNPEIVGSVRLNKGSVRDYPHGISLSEITGVLTGSHGVLRVDQLTARAAPGHISVAGTIGILQPKIPVDLKLTAKDAQPIASNIVTANLDAQVQVTGTAREQLDVGGKIHLNRANITVPGGLPPSVVVLDVERAGAPPPPPDEHPLVINLNLTLDAPRRILVSGRGLDAEMGGNLRIRGTAAAPVIEGGFELQRGSFTLANSKLAFSQGTVTFSGTGLQHKLDPSLDFTAQTQAAEVTAVIHITGLADAPQIELTSTPELPQDEILARLLFGQPAAQLTALQLVQTGAALASLRGGGNGPSLNPLTRIQKALGLDRLSVGGGGGAGSSNDSASSQQSSGASVQAGRYVSDRVYVGVKESTTGASQVAVDVDLTKGLKLQAKLGNGTATAQGVTPENDPGSSIGLAYQFEY